MIFLDKVYDGFCEKVILGTTKVMTFRVSFSTEIRAKKRIKILCEQTTMILRT